MIALIQVVISHSVLKYSFLRCKHEFYLKDVYRWMRTSQKFCDSANSPAPSLGILLSSHYIYQYVTY